MQIPSPDGEGILIAEAQPGNGALNLYLLRRGQRFPVSLSDGQDEWVVGAEAAWAPDSRAFFVSGSEGGAVGQFHTFVFLVRDDTVERLDLNPLIERAFGHPVACDVAELPNVVGIAWLKDSSRLALGAQILPHSICDSPGTFKAYEVSVLGRKILRRCDQITAKRLFWDYLGEELRAADDECIRRPVSCQAPANHPAKSTPKR